MRRNADRLRSSAAAFARFHAHAVAPLPLAAGCLQAGALKMSVGGQQGDALAFDDDF